MTKVTRTSTSELNKFDLLVDTTPEAWEELSQECPGDLQALHESTEDFWCSLAQLDGELYAVAATGALTTESEAIYIRATVYGYKSGKTFVKL